jgi:uncharacterized membrane protein
MRTVFSVIAFALLLLYPAAVYYGLTRLGTRQVVWLLIPLLLLGVLSRMPRERGARWAEALKAPAAMALLLSLTAFFDDRRFLLATPVLINLVLLVGFAGSLRGKTPLVERFARLQVDDLSEAEVKYCRQVTIVWSLFFVLNGSLAGLLALLAPLSVWALYTGAIAYVLIGLLGASEYALRKYRFGRYNDGLLDRILRAVLPARPMSRT